MTVWFPLTSGFLDDFLYDSMTVDPCTWATWQFWNVWIGNSGCPRNEHKKTNYAKKIAQVESESNFPLPWAGKFRPENTTTSSCSTRTTKVSSLSSSLAICFVNFVTYLATLMQHRNFCPTLSWRSTELFSELELKTLNSQQTKDFSPVMVAKNVSLFY